MTATRILTFTGAALFSFLFVVPVSAEGNCKSNEVFKDNLCWHRADHKMTLNQARDYCASAGYRLPSDAEARGLLSQYPGKKVRELGALFGVQGPFFFWVESTSSEKDVKVRIVLPGTAADMTVSADSKLYAQCVRSPD
ncbi:MAG: hypothetical protein KDK33_04840 [Leptospiraceae bacterium]|nr:hypothetical protein [Leptospiraceae bacterium]